MVGILFANGLPVESFGLFDLAGGLESLGEVIAANGGWLGVECLAEILEGRRWIPAPFGQAGKATGCCGALLEKRIGAGVAALRGEGFGEQWSYFGIGLGLAEMGLGSGGVVVAEPEHAEVFVGGFCLVRSGLEAGDAPFVERGDFGGRVELEEEE